MTLANDQLKDTLVESGIKIALNPKDANKTVSFVDSLELISYIVLDISHAAKADVTLPTPNELSQKWEELYNGNKLTRCEQVNSQFPNIYRIMSTSVDDLLDSIHRSNFTIKYHSARIYAAADCSFFEDLPSTVTVEKLEATIMDAIKQSKKSSSSLHVQIHKATSCACIITAGAARIWRTISYIDLDGKPMCTKDNLSFRLLLHPVPQTFNVQKLICHDSFSGKVTIYKQHGDNLILTTSDKTLYDEYINRGALRIDSQHTFHIEAYVPGNKKEETEIDDDTWYDTEMLQYKPDIMQFIVNPQHDVFQYQWNAALWLEQFNKTHKVKSAGKRIQMPHIQHDETGNQVRHLLQMTAMLNTLGSIRKRKYHVGNHEVKLHLNKNMKTIMYNHESILEKSGKMSLSTSTPYPKTRVSVVKDDCMIVYEQLVKKQKRPVLLNMASATSAGGGYRKGDGAQEENLFRRSDYCRSLDIGLDDFFGIEQAERSYCSSDGQHKSLSSSSSTNMYPMDEYGGIYTSGLTFFRQSQDVGYEYMNTPLENVCAIAMAAYHNPQLDGDMLAAKYAVGTRKKIENIFAIAYYQKHDSLVLSAFGCGAFHNPPDHIAKLFDSVINQYAGFFESITFAIIDDHNAGHRLNPDGNYKPFSKILDDKVVHPAKSLTTPHTMLGPYRLLADGMTMENVAIFSLTPCNYGGKCYAMYNENHTSQYSHPPICSAAAMNGTCNEMKDTVHTISFTHRNQCRDGGECGKINDDKHCQEYEHPSYCVSRGKCQDMNRNHLKQYRHLPLCKEGQKCLDYQKKAPKHCDAYRHCKSECPYGNQCANIHDRKHMDELEHHFPPPCSYTPYHCPYYFALSQTADTKTLSHEIQAHCLKFSHVCRYGRNCADKTTLHWEKSIHIARQLCPDGDKCLRMNEENHLNSYTHAKIADIRCLCERGIICSERQKFDHIIKYRHRNPNDDCGVVRFFGLNKDVDFVKNQSASIARVLNYIKTHNWKPLASDSIPSKILNWIRTVQPVHRCNPIVFSSILLHGHVMSRDQMEKLKKPEFVTHSVMHHSQIRRIKDINISQVNKFAEEYVLALVSDQFEKSVSSKSKPPGVPLAAVAAHPPAPTSTSFTETIRKSEKYLLDMIKTDVYILKAKAIEIAQASIELHSKPAGIGHGSDKELGTDKQVFSILGPHLGHYYGDVIIVFKREILHHPDADFSVQAATSFASGNLFSGRPWFGPDPKMESKRINIYKNSKLHASIPGYDYTAALEIIAVTSHDLNLKSMNVDLSTIFKRWLQVDSHQNVEAHLPPLIPLAYIDHIYIPKNLYHSLNQNAHKTIDEFFKHHITVTEHLGDPNQPMSLCGPMPTSPTRMNYQMYIVEELKKTYEHASVYGVPRPIRGFVITTPGVNFKDSLDIPLLISQAFAQYVTEHSKPPTDNIIYIYWQVMHSDMMLAISCRRLQVVDKRSNLDCLICYIAPTNVTGEGDYCEQSTYLNVGKPHQHYIFTNSKKYRAKSNTFHIGCNTDDFITYCLELHRSTGQVVLRHAGSNSIYNHEELSCSVSKTELDLTKLEFIQVTSGTQIAPVRNLMVYFEKQHHLHPTFDKNFKAKIPASTTSDNSAHGKTDKDDKSCDKLSAKASDHHGVKHHDTASLSLKPCPDNINCLHQYAPDGNSHNSKFSHPCRFAELCRNKEAHLTHKPHPCPQCRADGKCEKVTDPYHRAQYRHTDLPDFLIPCRDQSKCQNKSIDHLKQYSHGEQVFGKISTATKGDENL